MPKKVNQEDISVMEKLNAYLETAKITIKPSTAAVYQRYLDSYIQPYFKDMMYNQLTSDKVQEFITNLTKSGLSAVTVQAVYSFIKAGLKPSGKNALFDVALPKYSRQQVDYLSLDEQKRLEEVAKAAGFPMYLAMIIGLYTGIRLGDGDCKHKTKKYMLNLCDKSLKKKAQYLLYNKRYCASYLRARTS